MEGMGDGEKQIPIHAIRYIWQLVQTVPPKDMSIASNKSSAKCMAAANWICSSAGSCIVAARLRLDHQKCGRACHKQISPRPPKTNPRPFNVSLLCRQSIKLFCCRCGWGRSLRRQGRNEVGMRSVTKASACPACRPKARIAIPQRTGSDCLIQQ